MSQFKLADSRQRAHFRRSHNGLRTMGWLLLTLALTIGSAWSDLPTPPGARVDRPNQEQVQNNRPTSNKEQLRTQTQPRIVKRLNTTQSEPGLSENTEEHNYELLEKGGPRWLPFGGDWATAVFTGLLVIVGVVTAIILIGQLFLLKRQVTLSREEFIAAHPPRLSVSNVVIRRSNHSNMTWFWVGEQIRGQLYVTNIGSGVAKVVHSHCQVFWRQGTLPMERPYEGEEPNEFLQYPELVPGAPATGLFDSGDRLMGKEYGEVQQCSSSWHIWIMGFIEFADTKGFVRRTEFCRVWKMPDERFFPVEDIDYDCEV